MALSSGTGGSLLSQVVMKELLLKSTLVLQITNQPTYVNRFSLDQEESGSDSVVGKCVLSLPRYLWELGKKDEEGSEVS